MTLNDEIQALNNILMKYGEAKLKLPLVHSHHDVTRILKVFDGMGSLNDLYICNMNGHNIDKADESLINNSMREHMSNIHSGCIDFASKS